MLKKLTLFFLALACLTIQPKADLWEDLLWNFQLIRRTIEELPLPWEEREPLHIALDTCQQQVRAERLGFFSVAYLMDSFLSQYVHKVLPLMDQVPDSVLDNVVMEADYIKAQLFFAQGPMVMPPTVGVTPPENGCSVQILVREFLDLLADPGGTRPAQFAQTLDFEAYGVPGGGTFEWSLKPDPEDLQDPPRHFNAQGNRLCFRPIDNSTYRLRVVYTPPQGSRCEDVVLLEVAGKLFQFEE